LVPIFIVDGTIVNGFDINPDDVEDVSVLKGANATALFGERAKGGAIVITTKKRGPKQGIGVEFTQSVMADNVYVLPEYQNLYSGGGSSSLTQYHYAPGQPAEWQALDGKYFPDYTDDASWGPRMTGQEYIPWYAWFPGTKYSFKTAPLVASTKQCKRLLGIQVLQVLLMLHFPKVARDILPACLILISI
jgi:TonB-dependent SusC/RagA subfamily outer membrane receptor